MGICMIFDRDTIGGAAGRSGRYCHGPEQISFTKQSLQVALAASLLPGLLPVGGCAPYVAAPLEPSPAGLAAPVAGLLQAQAAAILRPWLAPSPVDLAAPLTLDGIAALAVVNNPDLAALRSRAGIADAQAFAAGLLPDPTFSFGVAPLLSGPDSLVNLTGALGLDLAALRRRAVTRQQARAQTGQVRLDLAWAEWQMAGQARIQAVRVLALEQMLALARQSAVVAAEQLDRAGSAAARGDLSAADAEVARLAAHDAADRLRTAERDLLAARQQLARLLGLPPATPLALAPLALPGPPPPADRLFAMAQAGRTDLAALRAGYNAQEAAVHKAVIDQFPTLNLVVGPARDSAGNLSLGPTIDFTLPLWNRNRGGIAIESATRAALHREYAARLFQTRADIAAASAGVELARQQRQRALAGLPALAEQAGNTEHARRRGDISRAAAITAGQQLRNRQLLIVQAELAISEQTIALELLSGEPIRGWQ